MVMDNVCYEKTLFKNIPDWLFVHSKLDLYAGKKSVRFKKPNVSAKLGITQVGLVEVCLQYRNTDNCTCYDRNNCDWENCSDGSCVLEDCWTYNIGGGGNGASGGVNYGGTLEGTVGSSPPSGGGNGGFNPNVPNDPNVLCAGTWYDPETCIPNGEDVNVYSPPEDYAYDFPMASGITLSQYFKCFDNAHIPDVGATYSVSLNVAIPTANDPDKLVKHGHPGHAFITMTKTNGSQAATQSFGFYPSIGPLSISMGPVASKIMDDGGHLRNAVMTMSNISGSQFSALQAIALNLTTLDYNLNDFNCTDYALAVFNSIRGSNVIIILDTEGAFINYGRTPNGLFKYMANLQSGSSNITVGISSAPVSHGSCN